MEVICKCGNNCIKPKSNILKEYKSFYNSCANCKDIKLKKFSPLAKQININLLDDPVINQHPFKESTERINYHAKNQ